MEFYCDALMYFHSGVDNHRVGCDWRHSRDEAATPLNERGTADEDIVDSMRCDWSFPASGLRFTTEIRRAGPGVPAAPTNDEYRSRGPTGADHAAAECHQGKCQ